jgi:hypothetical protein
MDIEISEDDLKKWNELVQSYKRYVLAHQAFFQPGVDRVGAIRRALVSGDRGVALATAAYLSTDEHRHLFNEWVRLLRGEGSFQAVRNFILGLPRDWVMERIEQAVEPYLNDAIDFRRYLSFYHDLDRRLMVKLARRAMAHPDPETRETGAEFLEDAGDADIVTTE